MDILFIGNSYTGNLRAPFCEMMAEIDSGARLEFKTGGGWTLKRHVEDSETRESIAHHAWDVVVLQEQSRVPTFSQESKAYGDHRAAIRTLAGWIREAGATPVLYETWGRRNGDRAAMKRSPDFDAMQAHLTASYADAGLEIGAQVVPVGQVWQAVRKADPELGVALHAKDGSHASDAGSYLLAATFVRALLGVEAVTLKLAPPMTSSQAALVHECVKQVVAGQ